MLKKRTLLLGSPGGGGGGGGGGGAGGGPCPPCPFGHATPPPDGCTVCNNQTPSRKSPGGKPGCPTCRDARSRPGPGNATGITYYCPQHMPNPSFPRW